MNLVGFHRFLIGAAIVFCAGFAAWMFVAFTRTGGTGSLLLAVGFAAAAAGLAVYLRHLRRFLGMSDRKD